MYLSKLIKMPCTYWVHVVLQNMFAVIEVGNGYGWGKVKFKGWLRIGASTMKKHMDTISVLYQMIKCKYMMVKDTW